MVQSSKGVHDHIQNEQIRKIRTFVELSYLPICPVLGFQITSIEASSGFSPFLVPAFGP